MPRNSTSTSISTSLSLGCLLLASVASSTAADAEHVGLPTISVQDAPVLTKIGWVGVGTPDCHTQGALLRIAHHCPPAAIAEAAAVPPATYKYAPRPYHVGHGRKHPQH
jgi:hypothetical protein